MSGQRIIALLGRRDEPTDAVEEYCRYLGDALHAHDFELRIERVAWDEQGWPTALRELRRQSRTWCGALVLVQYTALAWSARGFPQRFLRVLKLLRTAGVSSAVVYHDVEPYGGQRLIDKLRRRVQLRTMRKALRGSDGAIFTVPTEKVRWIPQHFPKAVFIPVGANLPGLPASDARTVNPTHEKPTVAVFGITGGDAGRKEIARIVEAVRFSAKQIRNLRLVIVGRNSKTAELPLRKALSDVPAEIEVKGILSAGEVARVLASSDVLLFVRGHISTRRSSAIAGIACGLPVIASAGPETAPPITEAGLAFYAPDKDGALSAALLRVLADDEYRASLAERSRLAQGQYFSWKVIAARYAEVLHKQNQSGVQGTARKQEQ
jgi:glycosyltransferase involved in cell wall biosynthesis